jgi:dCTP diphosphatase
MRWVSLRSTQPTLLVILYLSNKKNAFRDSVMDIEQIKQRLRNFAEAREWDQFHSPKNLASAVSVEAAELLEIFQWLTEEESKNLDEKNRLNTEQEIADVFLYLLRLSDKLNINLLQVAEKKIALNELKYPVELSKGNSMKYTEFKD